MKTLEEIFQAAALIDSSRMSIVQVGPNYYVTIERKFAGDNVEIRRNDYSVVKAANVAWADFSRLVNQGYTPGELQPTLLVAPNSDADIPF